MNSTLYKLLYISAILMLLASCMVGPRYNRPEMDLPESYIHDSTPDTIINPEWWTIFNDPLLKTLIDTALSNNRDIKMAAKRIEQAAYAVGYNRADLFPGIGYDGSVVHGNIGQNGAPAGEVGTLFSGVGNVYWELDFWGKYRRATQAAKAELLASEYGMRSVQISIISNVATLYFQLQDYKSRLDVSKETLETRQQSLWIIQERFNKGIVPELDLSQAKIQEAIAAANVPFYENLVNQSQFALSVLLGRYPGEVMTAPIDENILPDSIPAGIPSELLERRPDLAQLEQMVKAQNARIGIAQAMRWPSISLTGALGVASSDLENLLSSDAMVWSVAGNVTGPIFNFGKNKRRVDIERARTEEMKLAYENAVLQAFSEVERALFSVQAARQELVAYERQLIASSKAAELSWARYDGGVTGYLEVLETQRQNFDSELLALNAKSKLLNSYVTLYKALGGGWINEVEKLAGVTVGQDEVKGTNSN